MNWVLLPKRVVREFLRYPRRMERLHRAGIRNIAAWAIGLSILSPLSASAEDVRRAIGARIEVGHLHITKKVPRIHSSRYTYGTGTELGLIVGLKKLKIVKLLRKASTLETMMDDKNQSLGPEAKLEIRRGETINKESTVMAVALKAPGVPHARAKRLVVRGQLRVLAAASQKGFVQKAVVLEKGSSVQAGAIRFTVRKIHRTKFGATITFVTTDDATAFAGFLFFDAKGKALTFRQLHRSVWASKKPAETRVMIHVEGPVKSATIEARYWQDIKTVAIPFDVTTGIGLAGL